MDYDNGDIKIRVIEPFEVDPIYLLGCFYTATPRWRFIRRWRMRRELERFDALG